MRALRLALACLVVLGGAYAIVAVFRTPDAPPVIVDSSAFASADVARAPTRAVRVPLPDSGSPASRIESSSEPPPDPPAAPALPSRDELRRSIEGMIPLDAFVSAMLGADLFPEASRALHPHVVEALTTISFNHEMTDLINENRRRTMPPDKAHDAILFSHVIRAKQAILLSALPELLERIRANEAELRWRIKSTFHPPGTTYQLTPSMDSTVSVVLHRERCSAVGLVPIPEVPDFLVHFSAPVSQRRDIQTASIEDKRIAQRCVLQAIPRLPEPAGRRLQRSAVVIDALRFLGLHGRFATEDESPQHRAALAEIRSLSIDPGPDGVRLRAVVHLVRQGVRSGRYRPAPGAQSKPVLGTYPAVRGDDRVLRSMEPKLDRVLAGVRKGG